MLFPATIYFLRSSGRATDFPSSHTPRRFLKSISPIGLRSASIERESLLSSETLRTSHTKYDSGDQSYPSCNILVFSMRLTQLRQADLNLLIVFTALAEERNVSRAAKRLLLSQPAVTRALQRLRDAFSDDLLVRVSGNYELTPKGIQLLAELDLALPRLDRLLAGHHFNPAEETAQFHVVGTDYAAQVIGVPLARRMVAAGPHLSVDLTPLNDESFEAMERARVDVILHADDGRIPHHFAREVLFREQFVCVVAKGAFPSSRLTLAQYLAAPHVGVGVFGGSQTIPDQRLSAAGHRRYCPIRVSHFNVAMTAVAGTTLIATIPKRLACSVPHDPQLSILSPPKLLGTFHYVMIWHSRLEHDAAHQWLRQEIRAACDAYQS